MANIFGGFFPQKMVGVDIGTSAIKVVEISRWGKSKTLENYGEILANVISQGSIKDGKPGSNLISSDAAVSAIKAILSEARIKTKAAIFSVPDFSTFCTSFELPPMTEKEIPGAILYNASQYITLPISEVALDWRIIPNMQAGGAIKVFLVAIPNQVIQEYQNIAKLAGLQLHALESEMLGISRVLVKDHQKTICLMDIGVQSSTVNIIDKGFLKRSYSFNFNSNQLEYAIASALSTDYVTAEKVKNIEGLLSEKQGVKETLSLLIDPLLIEIKNISSEFLQAEQKEVDEIYITGGTANLPGLKEYFSENLKKNVVIPNCFAEFLYPPVLEGTLREMSPRFSAAIGVALGGLEA
jgi:type IV pilus assembly protein PilM